MNQPTVCQCNACPATSDLYTKAKKVWKLHLQYQLDVRSSLPVCQCEKWKVIEDSTSRERCLCPSDPRYGDKKPGYRGQRRYLQVLTLLVTAGWGESGTTTAWWCLGWLLLTLDSMTKKMISSSGVVLHAYNPSLLEAETGALNFTFKAILSYVINFQACLGEVAKILPKNKRKQKGARKNVAQWWCSCLAHLKLRSIPSSMTRLREEEEVEEEENKGKERKRWTCTWDWVSQFKAGPKIWRVFAMVSMNSLTFWITEWIPSSNLFLFVG